LQFKTRYVFYPCGSWWSLTIFRLSVERQEVKTYFKQANWMLRICLIPVLRNCFLIWKQQNIPCTRKPVCCLADFLSKTVAVFWIFFYYYYLVFKIIPLYPHHKKKQKQKKKQYILVNTVKKNYCFQLSISNINFERKTGNRNQQGLFRLYQELMPFWRRSLCYSYSKWVYMHRHLGWCNAPTSILANNKRSNP
jgi:preprotein translocase subunit SecG